MGIKSMGKETRKTRNRSIVKRSGVAKTNSGSEIIKSLRISQAMVTKLKNYGISAGTQLTEIQIAVIMDKMPRLLVNDLEKSVKRVAKWQKIIEDQGLGNDVQRIVQIIQQY